MLDGAVRTGTRVELSRAEATEVLVRFARQHIGDDKNPSEELSVTFSGENRYRNEKPKEQRCRDCGCNVLARSQRLAFDRVIIVINSKEVTQW